MDLQPFLENDLVLLRPLLESDFEALYEAAKDPLIWEQHPQSDRYKIDVFTNFFKDSIESKGALVIIDKSSKTIIGSSRYKPVQNTDNAIEIGWSFLARAYWGGRYNRSVKTLMMDHAFKWVENVVYYIGEENVRSWKAVEKTGGIRITESRFDPLIKKEERIWTFLIDRKSAESRLIR